MSFDAPPTAAPGSMLTVRHAWRVDALPGEPFADWYHAPFVKLIAPDGRIVVDVDGAVALPGWQWRAGEAQVSEVDLALPDDLPPGEYRLQSSLFDPDQKKNAVYFNVGNPDDAHPLSRTHGACSLNRPPASPVGGDRGDSTVAGNAAHRRGTGDATSRLRKFTVRI